jgi:hypothetical protein
MRFKPTKSQLAIGIGYIVFLVVFFFIGVTKQHLEAFIAIGLLTALYYVIVKGVQKILGV